MDSISKFPIDVDKLHKGQIIPTDELEALVGFASSSEPFRFAVLTIQTYINTRTTMTAVFRKDGLHILTDSQASGYNSRRFDRGLFHAQDRFRKGTEVDMANLTPAEAQQHLRNICNQGRFIAGIAATRRQIATEAHRRSIPGKLPERLSEPDGASIESKPPDEKAQDGNNEEGT